MRIVVSIPHRTEHPNSEELRAVELESLGFGPMEWTGEGVADRATIEQRVDSESSVLLSEPSLRYKVYAVNALSRLLEDRINRLLAEGSEPILI